MQANKDALHLVEVTPLFQQQVMAFRDSFGPGPIHGGFGLKEANTFKDWYHFVQQCKTKDTVPKGMVPASSYLLLNHREMVGIVNLRHRLNEGLLYDGGHIGYSIRPSYRGRGYGKKILSLCLDQARAIGLTSVLLTVKTDNMASIRVVKANGGRLENQVKARSGQLVNRYWIDLS
ncbi:Predicted acetyltransferase [Alloiococcus otitis]|uniref:N-acetyltransferase domain-containing protein n=1 Tax=Alloiococcus otitis ATCC 51267 TaxID=883081 RepID=K9E8C3_9LACT|nr:GNAT family N-acetyltransferase [Alloiococcus otitis]EKU93429.1 hypothetical protein HMPREF9698_00961 [Alloiococcus otitis ATCC 51267]SUU81430.1 Predicted acetyltransferase [Alloiococcus otitis]